MTLYLDGVGFVSECDSCGDTISEPDRSRAGWLRLRGVKTVTHIFCSIECLRDWCYLGGNGHPVVNAVSS